MDPFLYLDRGTIVHRLDPRTKMILLLGAFVLAFVFPSPAYGVVVLALVLLAGWLARALSNLRRIWFVLLMIAIVTTVLWSIFGSGRTPLFWFVKEEALLYGLGVACKLDTMIIAGMIFLSTTRNEEIANGLVRVGVPYRFAFAVSTAIRLVPTILATGATISQAQRSRGLDLDSGSILQRVRKRLPLLVPVFVSTIRSTNVFSMALESKGFGAGERRTYFMQFSMGRRDAFALAVLALVLAAAFALRIMGHGGIEGFSR
ncbi:MAG: energy-coupling factor transporter transmembrane protein EcfT [Rubrobacteraceae bacterium]|nr:energy-coupling factor transporter transmembrane protein EcfT [Rubrobacteraceae bacterium]